MFHLDRKASSSLQKWNFQIARRALVNHVVPCKWYLVPIRQSLRDGLALLTPIASHQPPVLPINTFIPMKILLIPFRIKIFALVIIAGRWLSYEFIEQRPAFDVIVGWDFDFVADVTHAIFAGVAVRRNLAGWVRLSGEAFDGPMSPAKKTDIGGRHDPLLSA